MMVYFYCEIYSEVRQMTHFYTTIVRSILKGQFLKKLREKQDFSA